MILLLSLSALVITFAAIQISFLLKRRRLFSRSWADLVLAIEPLNLQAMAAIAEDYLHPTSTQLRVEPDLMWVLVGGFEGLSTLRRNAKTMLDLAVYAERWSRTEGRVVGEMMRRDGIRLNRAIRKIELAVVGKIAVKHAAFELQEAVAAYYLMRGRLLGLYEAVNSGHHARLVGTV